MPRLLREIVEETVAGEPDMQVVVSGNGATDELSTLAADEAVDVVVCGAEPTRIELGRAFGVRPSLCVVALDPGGERAVLHELRLQRVVLGESSPRLLIAAIRDHAGATLARR